MEQDGNDAWQPSDEERQFVEDVAVVFEGMGLFRMAGRALGWLLICDPPEQTFNQVVTGLGASKGSVSAGLRFLVEARWVERYRRPGSRHDRFRMRDGGLEELTWQQMSYFGRFLDLTRNGLAMMPDGAVDRRRRLQEMHELFAWLDEELPRLHERWLQRRKEES